MFETLSAVRLDAPLWLGLLPLLLLGELALGGRPRPGAPPPGTPAFVHPLARHLALVPLPSARPAGALGRRLGLALLVLALAGPIRLGAPLPATPPARDVLFLVDTSVSMALQDYTLEGEPVARMDVLQVALLEVLTRLAADRVGLLVFAEQAYLWVPPTRDHGVLERLVPRLAPGLAGRGSELGTAIAAAARALEEAPGQRLLVLFGHGTVAAPRVPPDAAAAFAARHGITLHTIGIGAAVSQEDDAGRVGLVHAPVDAALLERLARTTGGSFHRAGDADALHGALAAVTARMPSLPGEPTEHARISLYRPTLSAGLVCLALAAWRGRPGAGLP